MFTKQELKKLLRPYQKEGTKLLFQNKKYLLADEMGLGKTIQLLAWVSIAKEFPVLVVCPASLKYNWAEEIKKWTGVTADICTTRTPYRIRKRIAIINYDILYGWKDYLKPKAILFDECHYLKNRSSKRSMAAKRICRNADHIKFASGTPIKKSPADLWFPLSIMNPDLFPSEAHFKRKFCGGKQTPWGIKCTGSTNIEELAEKIEPYYVQRLKKDVLPDLPEKQRTIIPVDVSLAKYALELEAQAYDADESTINKIQFLNKLKDIAADGKIRYIVDFVNNDLPEKVIIFCTHYHMMDGLHAKIKNSLIFDGRKNQKKKQECLDKFKTSEDHNCLIMQIVAGGIGLNITECSNVILAEYPWTMADIEQGEDRIHRIGQTNKCNIYYFVAKNTIEEKMLSKIQRTKETSFGILQKGTELDKNDLVNELYEDILR